MGDFHHKVFKINKVIKWTLECKRVNQRYFFFGESQKFYVLNFRTKKFSKKLENKGEKFN